MSQDLCIVGMAQKRSVCTIFGPRIARTKGPFSVPCQFMISPQARYLPSRIVLWGPSS